MTHHILTLRAGQTGRLRVTVTEPLGADTSLAGAVCVSGVHRPMQLAGDDLLIGAMPPGMWLYEVRCGGATVLYGHIEVAPSPLADATGEVGWQIDADLTADVAAVTVTLAEGLPGRDGAPGRDGRDGVDGATPEIGEAGTWVISGVDTGRPSVVTIDHAEHTAALTPAAGLADNYEAQGWQMTVAESGVVTDIAVEARDNREIIRPGPRWIKLWILDAGVRYHLATSSEARTQAIGQTAVWPIPDVRVEAGQTLVITVHDTPDGTGYGDCSQLSCRAIANTAADGGIITGADGLGLVTGWLPRYTVRMRVTDGVSTHGVLIVTRPDMEAYVAEYVAAHAPAVDLSDYQGPIHLRDADGNSVLRTGVEPADGNGHVYLGHDVIDIGLNEWCTHVVISGDIHAPGRRVWAERYISDVGYNFRSADDGASELGLNYGQPGMADDSAVYITHAGMFGITSVNNEAAISVVTSSVTISATNIYIGDDGSARMIVSYDDIEMRADRLRLEQTGYGHWSQGALHVGSSGYVVISPSDPA